MGALEVYRRMGAQTMDKWILLRMDSAQLLRLGSPAK
jgi:hypothetical protein